jgi:DHA1 family tetracycline resistance protein-like MFS transporter
MDSRHLLTIFGVVGVNMLAFGIVIPLLPYLAVKTGASEFQIGLLVAAYPLAQLVGFVILALAGSLPLLFLGRIIDGLTGGNINVAQAYIADVTGHTERGKAMVPYAWRTLCLVPGRDSCEETFEVG